MLFEQLLFLSHQCGTIIIIIFLLIISNSKHHKTARLHSHVT